MGWNKRLKFVVNLVCYIDQRFEAEDEFFYWQQRLKTLRLQSLISGLTLAVFWAYFELHRVAPLEDFDLDLQSILHLLGALLFAIAACLSLTEINLEVIWLPLACFFCGLMSQLRCEAHLRLLSALFATLAASFTLPLRTTSLWLVYLTAAIAFLVSSIAQLDVPLGTSVMNCGLLLLLLCSFYHAAWRAESQHRKGFMAGETVQSANLSPKLQDEDSEPDFAVLSLEADMSIRCCGEQESLFFKSDLTGKYIMDLVSMEDQHMIGLLAHTDSANRTILVNLVKPDDHGAPASSESFKFRLLPTGLQSPKWLAFFAKGSAMAATVGGPAAPGGPANGFAHGSSSMSASRVSVVSSTVHPTSPRVVLASPPAGDPSPVPSVTREGGPALPMTPIRSRNSQQSNKSLESKNSVQLLDPRRNRQISGDLLTGSPGLRMRQLSSENGELGIRFGTEGDDFCAPGALALRPPSQADAGLISNSVLSLSWSIGTENCRGSIIGSQTAKALSDGQTQTEISWTATSGWKCRNCQKPPRPPGESQTQGPGQMQQLQRELERLQGCWLLRAGPKQCVGWLQGFVVRGTEVITTNGVMTLEGDENGQIYFGGGPIHVDQDDVLHRAGKSGGTYLYVRVTEQRLAVSTDIPPASGSLPVASQGQPAPSLRPYDRHGSWNSVTSVLPG